MFSDAGKHLIIIKSPPSNPTQRKAICSIAFFLFLSNSKTKQLKKRKVDICKRKHSNAETRDLETETCSWVDESWLKNWKFIFTCDCVTNHLSPYFKVFVEILSLKVNDANVAYGEIRLFDSEKVQIVNNNNKTRQKQSKRRYFKCSLILPQHK